MNTIKLLLITLIISVSQIVKADLSADAFLITKATDSSSWVVSTISGAVSYCLMNIEEDIRSSPGTCKRVGQTSIKDSGYLLLNSTGNTNGGDLMIMSKSDGSIYHCQIRYKSPQYISSATTGCTKISSRSSLQ